MSEKRNSYLVSKALKTFMLASVLASLAQRLATMTDAIVVSNLIGPDAISAINVVTPIITLFPTISILFGIGGSIMAAKAIGRRDADEANRIFTTSLSAAFVCSAVLSIALFLLTPDIVALVCPRNSRFFDMAVSFMHIMSLSAVPTVLGFTLQSFVKTDGNPRLVMLAVMSSTALNLVLDIVFIKFFGMGIAGSAWGTIICFLFSTSVCLIHFWSSHSSFRLHFEWRHMVSDVTRCIAEGFPPSLSTLMMGVCVFGFNSIVMHTLGADGMYVWSVCLQLLMLIQLMLSGVSSSIYSIGGLLIGECDMIGLKILIRRVLAYAGIALLALLLVVETCPQVFGNMFGGGNSGVADLLHSTLRIFSLVLLPFSLIAILNALYQLLGYRISSMIISIGQLVAMVFFVWLFSLVSPSLLWWGYPASSIILAAVVLIVTWVMHVRCPELAPVTLIPQSAEGKSLNFSIRLTEADVTSALNCINTFLKECDIPHPVAYSVRLCCEELLYNIVHYAVKKHPDQHFIDIHIRYTDSLVTLLLKDDGRPFNPTLGTSDSMEHLGLRLVNGICQDVTYKYMYDQNMVFIKFPLVARTLQ
jgi:Na+-driven multidrug efflux pump/anti-sigma regulatory factor (Ser/Thr protein kinase)